jgi:hypothetical protein
VGIFEDAHVTAFVADYLAADASNRITAVGLGFTITGVQPTGFSAPQYLGVIIRVPSKYTGQQFSLSVHLRDEDADTAVTVPGASGQSETLQVAQVVTVAAAVVPGLYLPPSVACTMQMVMGFPTGLPLTVGKNYAWHVQIDGQSRRHWIAGFHVPGAPPAPVFGGPVGPTDIPNISPPSTRD